MVKDKDPFHGDIDWEELQKALQKTVDNKMFEQFKKNYQNPEFKFGHYQKTGHKHYNTVLNYWTQLFDAMAYSLNGKMPMPAEAMEKHMEISEAVTVYAWVRAVNGALCKIRLNSPPQIHSEYHVANPTEQYLEKVDLQIEHITYEGDDGNVQFKLNGPFTSKTDFATLQQAKVPSPKTPPGTVMLEHNGQIHTLHPGDMFSIVMPVWFGDQKVTEAKQDVKIISIGNPDSPWHIVPGIDSGWGNKVPGPIDPPSDTSFEMVHIEDKNIFLINGFYKNTRYEVVIGEHISGNKQEILKQIFGEDYLLKVIIPDELWRMILTAVKQLDMSETVGASHHMLHHPLMKKRVKCPDRSGLHADTHVDSLQGVIMHLNDTHSWTREAIAEWLDTLDEQPVYYPRFTESSGVENSARVVEIPATVQEGPI